MRSQLGFSSSDKGYLHSRLSCWWDGSLCVWQHMIFMNVSPTPVFLATILMYLYLDGNRCIQDNSAWCKHFVCTTYNTQSMGIYNRGIVAQCDTGGFKERKSETGAIFEQIQRENCVLTIFLSRVFQWYLLMYSTDLIALNNAQHWYSNSSRLYTVVSHNNRALLRVKASHQAEWKTINNVPRIQVSFIL